MTPASLKKNYLYNLFSQVLIAFVPVILIPYTSRALGPDNLGIYSYTFSAASVFATVGQLGIGTYGKLQIAQNRDDIEIRSRIFWELISLELVLTAAEILLYSLTALYISEYRIMSLIMIVYLVGVALDISWMYQGVENYKFLAVRKVCVNLLNLVLILLIIHGRNDLYRYALIMQGTTLVSNMALWKGLGRYIIKPRFLLNENTKKHLQRMVVYFLPTIGNLIYNTLDKVMLGYIGGSTAESGYYEESYSIIGVVNGLVMSFGSITLPRLTYLYFSGERGQFLNIFRKTMRMSLMLLFPMSAGLFVNAELIIRTVLGEKFLGGVNVLRILGILLTFGSLNYNIGNQVLVSTEHQKQFNIGIFSGACLNFILNLLLIRNFYAIGAAIGSLLAEMIIYAIYIYYSKAIVGIKALLPCSTWKYLLATSFMIVFNIILNHYVASFTPIVQLATVVSACASLYFLLLLCMREEEMLTITGSVWQKIRARR